jgi:hypothetical protein
MKIGVLGTGVVGQTLASGFRSLGDEVTLGSREANNPKAVEWAQKNGGHAATFADAAKFGELLVLATPWTATQTIIELAGPENFVGKVVLDPTNPLEYKPGALPTLSIGHSDSAGEQVQRWLPGAHVVKCFNIVGAPHMIHPSFAGQKPDMVVAGNDPNAKATAQKICEAFGWSVIDLGAIEMSRYLEPLAMVWIVFGIRNKSFDHAFAFLRK